MNNHEDMLNIETLPSSEELNEKLAILLNLHYRMENGKVFTLSPWSEEEVFNPCEDWNCLMPIVARLGVNLEFSGDASVKGIEQLCVLRKAMARVCVERLEVDFV